MQALGPGRADDQLGANPSWHPEAEAFSRAGTLSGDHRLDRTSDGGATREPVTNLPTAYPRRVCGLSVVDERTVYLSGTNYPNEHAAVLKTVDGGNSWESIDMRPHAALLVDIHFKDRDEG
jgi:photosystem II stability/assembly factor-like uncharacterized protein